MDAKTMSYLFPVPKVNRREKNGELGCYFLSPMASATMQLQHGDSPGFFYLLLKWLNREFWLWRL